MILKNTDIYGAHVVIFDDEPANVLLLERLLEQLGYQNVKGFTDPIEGWEYIQSAPTDLLLLDLQMPRLTGFEVLERLKNQDEEGVFLPVMVLTADATVNTKRQALSLGAHDFLTKPFEAFEVALRVKNLLRVRLAYKRLETENNGLEAKVLRRTAELERTQFEIIERLAAATEYRDDDTHAHTHRVGELASIIAKIMGLDAQFVHDINFAAQLHDVGKIGVSDTILLKPGKLTEEEYEIMKKHTVMGANILKGGSTSVMRMAEEIALTHHERWDGKGYPHGLAGEDIPMSGRIVSVVDVWDALTHSRPYKEAWPQEKALNMILENAGTQFDPKVAQAFVDYIQADALPKAA
ncbi:MAG TPA: HD domain-containing phosphohydrolase [Fimbriimonas sp.]|nr:HD domain-containing phosphohydrolase [Fimbriimonas sp.]